MTVLHIRLFVTVLYVRMTCDCLIYVTVSHIPMLTVLWIRSQAEEGRAAEALRADAVLHIRIICDFLKHVTVSYIPMLTVL